MRVVYKVWLEKGGKVFGQGTYQLLKGIEKTGSLHRAAMEMEMSYRTAWCMFRKTEKRLGFALLERKIGGRSGGGSRITPEGKNFMQCYESFQRELGGAVERLYHKHFAGMLWRILRAFQWGDALVGCPDSWVVKSALCRGGYALTL